VKTGTLDYLLCGLSLTVLLGLATGAAWLASTFRPLSGSPYRVLLAVAVFLLSYGLFTAALRSPDHR
jgi:hypothetical protein